MRWSTDEVAGLKSMFKDELENGKKVSRMNIEQEKKNTVLDKRSWIQIKAKISYLIKANKNNMSQQPL